MPNIISIGTAVPQYAINSEQAKNYARAMFQNRYKDLDRLLKIFDHTQIDKRYFCVPIEWFNKEHSFEEKNQLYIENAVKLGKKALNNALAKNSTQEIDHIIFVSSTGIATPSIDAYLYNEPDLSFRSNIKRTPIWGLGCAGGAVGLSRAFEYTTAFPKEKVLVIALEIGELAFLKDDYSKSNLIATSLFGDGAAAVLVVGDEAEGLNKNNNLKIIASQSTIWEDSMDVMGWEVKNDGLKVIFSKDIPSIVKTKLMESIQVFLNKYNLSLTDIQFYVLHPGGTKVLEAYQEVFAISNKKTHSAQKILREYGNMSSPTVLFVLKEIMEQPLTPKGYGLLLALGPGFSSEILLLHWG